MLERVVLSDKMRKNKATEQLMTRQEKIDYVTKWKIKNKHILEEGGLLAPKRGDAARLTTPLKFGVGSSFQYLQHGWWCPIFRGYFKQTLVV